MLPPQHEDFKNMKGYWNGSAYMGWIPSKQMYCEFVSDTEYHEAYEEDTK